MDAWLEQSELPRILRMVRRRMGPGWRHLDHEQIAVNAWFYSARRTQRANARSVYWACCDALDKARVRPDLVHAPLYDRFATSRDDPAAILERAEERQLLRARANRLLMAVRCPMARRMLAEKYMDGLTYAELARKNHCSVRTVRYVVAAARREAAQLEKDKP